MKSILKNQRSKLGDNISVDALCLVDTRLLVQANSGGGKSYAIRKLLEATHGKIQQIVLDIEGDFSSLREKFDFVLAGKAGDIPASVKSAALLARKALELEVNLIVDLYELKQHERIMFVKLFLEEMINAPKHLWHPVLLVIDEAHLFAPEKGNAESMSAVIDMCTRGRKRGYGVVLATQRLSKLHKDAAAECNNKLIGRTNLDIDVKRAADELGMGSKEMANFRSLKPGEFFAFGPAISDEIVRGMIGKAITAHPVAGARGTPSKPIIASSKIKQALKELSDLPKEAEEELKTKEDLKAKIKQLTFELASKPAPQIDQSKIDAQVAKTFDWARAEMKKQYKEKFKSLKDELVAVLAKYADAEFTTPQLKPIQNIVQTKIQAPAKMVQPLKSFLPKTRPVSDGEIQLGACEKKIVGFLASQSGKSFSKVQAGAMTGYAHSSGGFNNALSKLTQVGYILRDNGMIRINPDMDLSDFLSGVSHTLQDWIAKLGACERAIYTFLLNNQGQSFDKNTLAENTSYSAGSGGFNNSLSRLSTLGLIKRDNGMVRINEELTDI